MKNSSSIFLASLGLFLFSLFRYSKRGYLSRDGIEIAATVIGTEKRYVEFNDGHGYLYFPIVRYEVDGVQFINETQGLSEPRYSDGDRVSIYHDKDNPYRIQLKGYGIDTNGLKLLAVIATFFLLVGLVINYLLRDP
ncbi:MAG: DUF3592 domain-containing protein [Coriobacteriia bacterium]|nr:DUF3592 domain-containing protein [Coriobacteriia bacterium]